MFPGMIAIFEWKGAREEAKEVATLSSIKNDALKAHLSRLQADGYIFQTSDNCFIVTPKAYFLIERSLEGPERDKARLLNLNKQRFV